MQAAVPPRRGHDPRGALPQERRQSALSTSPNATRGTRKKNKKTHFPFLLRFGALGKNLKIDAPGSSKCQCFSSRFFFSRHPASRLKKGNEIRFRISCFFIPVFYSAWHDRNKCRIPSGKSVNSPILLMMGAAVDDALRRLQSKDESFAVAARWERLSFSWSLERVASSQSDAPGNSKCQCFSPRFFFFTAILLCD